MKIFMNNKKILSLALCLSIAAGQTNAISWSSAGSAIGNGITNFGKSAIKDFKVPTWQNSKWLILIVSAIAVKNAIICKQNKTYYKYKFELKKKFINCTGLYATMLSKLKKPFINQTILDSTILYALSPIAFNLKYIFKPIAAFHYLFAAYESFKFISFKIKKWKYKKAKQKHARQEQARQEQARQEQARQKQVRQEQARQEQARQEQVRQEQARQEQARQEQAKQEQAEAILKQEEAILKQEEARLKQKKIKLKQELEEMQKQKNGQNLVLITEKKEQLKKIKQELKIQELSIQIKEKAIEQAIEKSIQIKVKEIEQETKKKIEEQKAIVEQKTKQDSEMLESEILLTKKNQDAIKNAIQIEVNNIDAKILMKKNIWGNNANLFNKKLLKKQAELKIQHDQMILTQKTQEEDNKKQISSKLKYKIDIGTEPEEKIQKKAMLKIQELSKILQQTKSELIERKEAIQLRESLKGLKKSKIWLTVAKMELERSKKFKELNLEQKESLGKIKLEQIEIENDEQDERDKKQIEESRKKFRLKLEEEAIIENKKMKEIARLKQEKLKQEEDERLEKIMREKEIARLEERAKRTRLIGKNRIEDTFNQDNCAICIDEFDGESDLLTRLPCGHIFHNNCITEHLLSKDFVYNNKSSDCLKCIYNKNCPLCRENLTENFIEKHFLQFLDENTNNQEEFNQKLLFYASTKSSINILNKLLKEKSVNINSEIDAMKFNKRILLGYEQTEYGDYQPVYNEEEIQEARWTPLHFAAHQSNYDTIHDQQTRINAIKTLLNYGANNNTLNSNKFRPIDLITNKNSELHKYLQNK